MTAPPLEEWIAEAVLYRLDTPHMDEVLTERREADARRIDLLDQHAALRGRQDELARMFALGQISRSEWKTARDVLDEQLRSIDRQLTQLTGSAALEGVIGSGSELRKRWSSLNLERQAAIVQAVLDYATITPTGSRVFDPSRVLPVWNL